MEVEAGLFSNEKAPTVSELKGEDIGAAPAKADIVVTETPAEAGTDAELATIRQERDALETEIADLRGQIEEARGTTKRGKEVDGDDEGETEKEGDDSKEFKVLSDEEYEALVEEDPVEAMKYVGRLRSHERERAERRKSVEKAHGAAMMVAAKINEEVPGLYAENSPVAQALVKFCESEGVSQDVLNLLADPSTQLLVDGKPVRLGDGARQLTVLIASSYERATGRKVRARSKKAATRGGKDSADRSRKDEGDGFPRTDAERKLARMSPEEQRRWLSGG